MIALAVRRLGWSLVAILALVSVAWAASSTSSDAVCEVGADYAIGIEDYPEAIRLHENILRHNPNDALAHYHLGFAYGMSHDPAGELREYQRAEQLGLRQWDLFLNLGILYLENHDTSAAIAALTTAARLGSHHPEAHFNLALAYERAGLLHSAQREILASLKLEPDQRDAQNTLAVIYAEAGDYKDARAVWTELVRVDPDNQPALRNLAALDRTARNSGQELAGLRRISSP
jgi:Flp pilus assembly protein TadD